MSIRGTGAAIAVAYFNKYGRPGSWLRYGQFRPMPSGLYTPAALSGGHIDCSAFATLVYKEAGAPDPNGRGYDGYGYTGTLAAYGTRVSGPPQALDLAFYGGPYPYGHVAVCINAEEVVSFGHTPIERYPIRYREDFVGIWRYHIPEPEPVRKHYLELLPWPAGGRGPKVNGPWVDTRDIPDAQKWPAVRRLAARMKAEGLLVALRTKGDRAWILHYAPATYGNRLRWGPWDALDLAEGAREIIEPRSGPLRLFIGASNTHYPMV